MKYKICLYIIAVNTRSLELVKLKSSSHIQLVRSYIYINFASRNTSSALPQRLLWQSKIISQLETVNFKFSSSTPLEAIKMFAKQCRWRVRGHHSHIYITFKEKKGFICSKLESYHIRCDPIGRHYLLPNSQIT